MPLPEFDDREKYLIYHVKRPNVGWSPMIGGYITAALLFGFAAYYGNILFMTCAFAVVYGFRIHEERSQSRWHPVWRSIIFKYESALGSVEPSQR